MTEYACVAVERPTVPGTGTSPRAGSSAQVVLQYRTDHYYEEWGRGEPLPPQGDGCWTSSDRPAAPTRARGGSHHPHWTPPPQSVGETRRDGGHWYQMTGG